MKPDASKLSSTIDYIFDLARASSYPCRFPLTVDLSFQKANLFEHFISDCSLTSSMLSLYSRNYSEKLSLLLSLSADEIKRALLFRYDLFYFVAFGHEEYKALTAYHGTHHFGITDDFKVEVSFKFLNLVLVIIFYIHQMYKVITRHGDANK